MIGSIRNVALYVGNQEAAREFWVDRVGFEVRRDDDMGEMGRWLEVAPPGAVTSFVIADAAAFGKQDKAGASADITLSAPDVRELHVRLSAAGVAVTDPETESWGTFVKITDPDGLEIFVTQSE